MKYYTISIFNALLLFFVDNTTSNWTKIFLNILEIYIVDINYNETKYISKKKTIRYQLKSYKNNYNRKNNIVHILISGNKKNGRSINKKSDLVAIRTQDLLLRRQLLYPAELRDQRKTTNLFCRDSRIRTCDLLLPKQAR